MRARIGDHFEIVDDQSVKEVEITSLKPLNYQEISRRPIQKTNIRLFYFIAYLKAIKWNLFYKRQRN